jgi:hypothetical protein
MDAALGSRAGRHPEEPGQLGKRLRDDARLRNELAYCVPLGIPHSVFKSWDVDDQDKALAYRYDDALRCRSCGTRADDWDDDPDAFIADVEICKGCERIEEEHENDIAKRRGAKVGLLPKLEALAKVETYAEEGGAKRK